MNLNKTCRSCKIDLTVHNAAKKNSKYYRNECKKCRSASVVSSMVGNKKRQSYMRDYIRKKGIVKDYPCEYCASMCYKKYAKAFCSDKCRFLSYVRKTDYCWIWEGATNHRNYGKFSMNHNKNMTAHRASYELFNGELKDNLFVCHSCDNTLCVNPDHLWLGTHIENMMDMIEKGRYNSRLYPYEVIKIRNMKNDGVNLPYIMEKFSITSSHISSILARRIWKHV